MVLISKTLPLFKYLGKDLGANPILVKSDMAQRSACLAHNQKVIGSNPIIANPDNGG